MFLGIFIAMVAIMQCEILTLVPPVMLCARGNKYIDCSNIDLKVVPDEIPQDTEVLILRNNSISSLPPRSFSKFANLLYLDLSDNKLHSLHKDLFKGLHRLQTLDLSRNTDLQFNYDAFPIGVFLPLGESLQTLRLLINLEKHVTPILSYADNSIADLYNLRNLRISMFSDVAFGVGFANLTKLQVLETHPSNIGQLYNNTLRYLRNSELRHISLYGSGILAIEPETFSGFPKLEFLDLSQNPDLGLETALDSLKPLEHQHLKEIRVVRVHHKPPPISFDKTMWLKLRNICVETLDISDNFIVAAEFFALSKLKYPTCFKKIRAAYHLISRIQLSFIYLSLLTNLTEVDFSGSPDRRPHARNRRTAERGMRSTDNWNAVSHVMYMTLPTSLKVINMSYAINHTPMDARVRLANAENVEVIDVAYSDIHKCYFPIEGLTNLKILNISYSNCSDMKKEFLFAYENLTVLSFRQAALDNGLKSDPDGVFLSKQRNLDYLDLCCNGLIKVHDNLLNQNKKITWINLSNNKLQNVPEAVLKSETLHHIDMSFNVLSSLTEHERHILDSHVRPDRPFSLM